MEATVSCIAMARKLKLTGAGYPTRKQGGISLAPVAPCFPDSATPSGRAPPPSPLFPPVQKTQKIWQKITNKRIKTTTQIHHTALIKSVKVDQIFTVLSSYTRCLVVFSFSSAIVFVLIQSVFVFISFLFCFFFGKCSHS